MNEADHRPLAAATQVAGGPFLRPSPTGATVDLSHVEMCLFYSRGSAPKTLHPFSLLPDTQTAPPNPNRPAR